MNHCAHIDITFVQSYRTRKGLRVAVFECDYCGKEVKELDYSDMTPARSQKFLVFSN